VDGFEDETILRPTDLDKTKPAPPSSSASQISSLTPETNPGAGIRLPLKKEVPLPTFGFL
jgi:hypothetical protein